MIHRSIHRAIAVPAAILSVALACGACEGSRAATPVRDAAAFHLARRHEAVDLGTPEAALRSWWRLSDASAAALEDGCAAQPAPDSLLTQAAAEAWAASRIPQTLSREIVSIDTTGSRAAVTVRVRNTTPRPVGASPSAAEVQRRRNGDLYRYLLAHGAAGWRIARVQTKGLDEEQWHDAFDPAPRLPVQTRP